MQILKDKFSRICDEELMLHIVNGEVKAFDELYKRYGKRLLGYFMRMLSYDKQIAEDALQDIFMKIAEAPEKFDGSRPFKTWIFSIASNYCKNIYRHNAVVEKCHSELSFTSAIGTENEFRNVTAKIEANEFKNRLFEVLDQLSPERKEAFILRYQEDKSIAEIAFIQGCPEGSVKSRLHYTLKILEEQLHHYNPLS